jgi:hypothetical protein
VLGLVYSGADPVQAFEEALAAHLDGLALAPDFADFAPVGAGHGGEG